MDCRPGRAQMRLHLAYAFLLQGTGRSQSVAVMAAHRLGAGIEHRHNIVQRPMVRTGHLAWNARGVVAARGPLHKPAPETATGGAAGPPRQPRLVQTVRHLTRTGGQCLAGRHGQGAEPTGRGGNAGAGGKAVAAFHAGRPIDANGGAYAIQVVDGALMDGPRLFLAVNDHDVGLAGGPLHPCHGGGGMGLAQRHAERPVGRKV